MKTLYRTLCVIGAALLLLLAVPSAAEAALPASGKHGSNLSWSITTTGVLKITGTGAMEEAEEYPWSIYGDQVKTVKVGSGVTSIGGSAFFCFTELASVTLPAGLKKIGNDAFSSCMRLTALTIPDSVTSIGEYAFTWSGLKSCTLPTGLTKLQGHVFEGCGSLTALTVPSGVTSVGEHAFYGCSALATLTLPATITAVGKGAFGDCAALKKLNLPNIKAVPEAMCIRCRSLTSVTLPAKVGSAGVYLGDNAFENCKALPAVTIPSGVQTVGRSAFACCDKLTSVTMPATVTKLEAEAFYGTPWNMNKGMLTVRNNVVVSCDPAAAGTVTVPDGVTRIGEGAFKDCEKITTVILPDSVTVIDSEAFRSCALLRSVSWPASLTRIGYYAFGDCTRFTGGDLPAGLKIIGAYAFRGCSALTSVKLPATLVDIEACAFARCTGLSGSLTIPAGIETLSESVFYRAKKLTSVTVPASVKQVEDNAFGCCSGLQTVTFKGNAPTFGAEAFASDPEGSYPVKATVYRPCGATGWTASVLKDYGGDLTWKKTHGKTELRGAKAAAAASDGYTGDTYCTVCGAKLTTGTVIPRTGSSATVKTVAEGKLLSSGRTVSGNQITWQTAAGANAYRVLRGTSSDLSSMTVKATVTGTSWTDTAAVTGRRYYYRIRPVYMEGGRIIRQGNCSAARYVTTVRTPEGLSASRSRDGILLTWKKVTGASGYRIQRKAAGGSWKKLTDVKGAGTLRYTDTTAVTGKTYSYRICAYYENGDGRYLSVYSNATKALCAVKAPVSISRERVARGIKVTWKKVAGAAGYQIQRRTEGGEWKTVKKLTGAASLSWTDTAVTTGTRYAYRVRAWCLSGDKTCWGEYRTGTLLRAVKAPASVKKLRTADGFTFSWKKVAGADGYVVERKAGDGSWKVLKKLSGADSLSITDGNLITGKNYRYRVKAYVKTESGNIYSTCCTGKTAPAVRAPRNLKRENAYNGVKLTWNKISNASGYLVMRKTGTGSWKLIKTIKSSSTAAFTDTTVTAGKKYSYRIYAWYGSTSVRSIASSTVTACWLERPVLASVTSKADGKMTLTWDRDSGVTGYEIRRSYSSPYSDYRSFLYTKTGAEAVRTFGSLDSGRNCYVMIRAYKKVDGVRYLSVWSTVRSCRIR